MFVIGITVMPNCHWKLFRTCSLKKLVSQFWYGHYWWGSVFLNGRIVLVTYERKTCIIWNHYVTSRGSRKMCFYRLCAYILATSQPTTKVLYYVCMTKQSHVCRSQYHGRIKSGTTVPQLFDYKNVEYNYVYLTLRNPFSFPIRFA